MPAPDAARPPEGGPDTIPVQEIKDQGTSTGVDAPAPYAYAWEIYADAGWPGVLPILTRFKGQPTDGKFPPPTGFTGRRNAGIWPTVEQMETWASLPDLFGNIALRPPEHVIGLDCDAYDGKHGDRTMAACVAAWGELPPTWRSSSRELDPDEMAGWDSGIYWFKVPSGLAWPGKLPGGDVEIIQHGHRYAVVWPSIHPSGRLYRWWDLDADDWDPDTPANRVPSPSEFPDLPASWIAGLTMGQVQDHDVDLGEAESWLTEGEPCQAMAKILEEYTGHRADVRKLQVKILRHGEQGHRGGRAAWDRLRDRYVADVTTGTRDGAEEWSSLAGGAPAQVKNRTPADRRRCCLQPALTMDKLMARRNGGGRS